MIVHNPDLYDHLLQMNHEDYQHLADQLRGMVNLAQSTIKSKKPIQTDEIYNERMDICKECEFLEKNYKRCMKCGCFMSVKAKLTEAKCPVNKW